MSYIICPALAKIQYVKHFFFTRNIEGSSHLYIDKSEEKLKDHSNVSIIKKNKAIIAALFDQDQSDLYILNQIHSNKVITVDQHWSVGEEPQGDALVTDKLNTILAIMTADCGPLLFAACNQPIIGAAHAGWQGARNGIIEHTVNAMLNLGAKLKDITVNLGACIHQDCYEVGLEFYHNFIEEAINNAQFFIKSSKINHFKFDLPGYIIHKLRLTGISSINNMNRNTFTEAKQFFSYRRLHLTGNLNSKSRLLSAIALKL